MKTASCPTTETPASQPVRRRLVADSLLEGVVVLLVLSAVQRLVGFGRGLLFCRWLDPDELGRWDLTLGFIVLVGPMAVLGLPGCYSRYVEYYRARDQLKTFLLRTMLVTVFGVLATAGILILFRDYAAEILYGEADATTLILCIAITLPLSTSFNALAELLNGLRMYRYNSILQMINSLLFAIISLSLLHWWMEDSRSVVLGFAGGCLISLVVGSIFLAHSWHEIPAAPVVIRHTEMWQRILPFAFGVWLVNWVSNTFATVDRYMLLHLSGLSEHDALVAVGNYSSARIVPAVLASLAALLGNMLTSHLSRYWEAGEKRRVAEEMHLALKFTGLSISLASAAVMIIAPWLFDVAFEGKYPGGLLVLPMTLTYTTWLSLGYVAEKQLYCAERTRLISFCFLGGLLLNVVLNYFLIPTMGLQGAVLGTTLSNLATLILLLGTARKFGLYFDRGTWLVALLPVLFPLGVYPTLAGLLVLTFLGISGEIVFSDREKERCLNVWHRFLARGKLF